MHYSLNNVLKIAKSSDPRVCFTFLLKFHFTTQQFLFVGVQSLFSRLRNYVDLNTLKTIYYRAVL